MRVLDGFDEALARRLRAELEALDVAVSTVTPSKVARRRRSAKIVNVALSAPLRLTEGSGLSRWLPI
jgi:hypothetical protein